MQDYGLGENRTLVHETELLGVYDHSSRLILVSKKDQENSTFLLTSRFNLVLLTYDIGPRTSLLANLKNLAGVSL